MLVRKNYKPKLFFVVLVFLILYLVVITRLFIIQVYHKDFFKILAKQQYVTEITTQPSRAFFYDRNNVPLTLNRDRVSAFILPHRFHEEEKIKKLLKNDFGRIYKKMRKEKRRRFLWLERHLSDERLKKIKSYESKDIYFLAEPERFYPFPSTAHIVGFTNVDNVGIAGMELQYNKRVGGTPTTFILEKDARSGYFYFHKDIKEKGVVGEQVKLTIDKTLQFFSQEELQKTVAEHEAKGGAVVIMDPDSGEILAMASDPKFDPNNVRKVKLSNTKNIPVTECFELGSVIKIFTALAALEESVVTIDEEIDCEEKSTKIDGFPVANWKSLGPGLHPFWQVVWKSNNVGIAKVAKRLGPKLYYHLKRLGFGRATGIRFPGERSGFVNPPHKWSRSSIIVLSFGYEIMATLLQLAKAFSIVANGGYNVQPTLVLDPPRQKLALGYKRLYKKQPIEEIKEILELKEWVKDKYGIKGYRIMGKTGTARSVKNGRYSNKDHVYTYAGIVEKIDPKTKKTYRRVIITFVKEPQEKKSVNIWSSQITLPLFSRIAEKMIVHDLGKGLVS